MKRLNGMKKLNNIVVTAAVLIGLISGFSHVSRVIAAQTDDQEGLLTYDYLDPFDLTVTSMTMTELQDTSIGTVQSSEPTLLSTDGSTSIYAQPLKIWIPYRPTFRSPCVPSW